MSDLTQDLLQRIAAFSGDMQARAQDPEERSVLADEAAEIALDAPGSLPELSGVLNMCRAGLIAISDEADPARAAGILRAVVAAASAVMKAACLPEHPETPGRLNQAAGGVMQAMVRYQSGSVDTVSEDDESGEAEEVAVAPVAAAGPPATLKVVDVPFQIIPPEPDAELLGEFMAECRDYLNQSEAALLALETNPDDTEAVNTVFRAFHTIKGTSGFVGTDAMVQVAHRAETLLSRVRDREVRYEGVYADLALQATDMIGTLIRILDEGIVSGVALKPDGFDLLLAQLDNPEVAAAAAGQTVGRPDELDAAAEGAEGGPKHPAGEAKRSSQAGAGSAEGGGEATLRVRMDRLDKLIDTVGELVISHSMVAQDAVITSGAQLELAKKVAHAGKLVRELQDLSMTMRMVPMKATFQKMGRLVRDVARKSGKQVDLVTSGEDTEIDRNMVDAITDPLVHMMRNAVDHGVEPPDVRRQLGKPERGTVRLAAYHAEGNVVVSIQDDGRGIDAEKVVQKAVSKGLIDSGEGMTERQVYDLLFYPGFSTAEKVTDVSGRGVGMDVVKRNVMNLGGQIDIASTLGEGSVFSVRVPLTLAVTDGMLVRVGAQRFIVPTLSISLSFRPTLEALSTVAGRGEMVRFRERMLPIVRVHELFSIPDAAQRPEDGLLIIVEDSRGQYALLVDELQSQHQVVTKPLGAAIGRVPGVAGAAILGDGRVGLILDTGAISALALGSREPEHAAA